MSRLMIVDGNSIMNRAFYGLLNQKMLASADGTPTNAVYGFMTIILKQYREIEPDYFCVTFDLKKPTFRHLKYSGYKAQRKGMPEELAVQMPIIKKTLKAFGIEILEAEGYEADDIIGTVSRICDEKDIEAYILTGDKDSLQLASKNTHIALPITKSGNTQVELYDEDAVFEKYGVKPIQMIEVKSLMGDSSDNIPGVKGVGEKTALDLIKSYSDLDGVYTALENGEITKKALSAKLTDDKENAYLSRELAIINRFVPGIDGVESALFSGFFNLSDDVRFEVYKLFKALGFNSLIAKLQLNVGENNQNLVDGLAKASEVEVVEITECSELTNIVQLAKMGKKINVFPVVSRGIAGTQLEKLGLSFEKGKAYEIMVAKEVPASNLDELISGISKSEGIEQEVIAKKIAPLFSSEIIKNGHNIKQFLVWLYEMGISPDNFDNDIAVAAYVVNPSLGERQFDELCEAYGVIMAAEVGESVAVKASLIDDLCFELRKNMQKLDQLSLYTDIEMPLVEVLASMEYEGFKIDIEMLKEFKEKLARSIGKLESQIYELAGHEFNINSSKQLGVVLFEELGLPVIKKTKTKSGYSTDASVLEELRGYNEIVEKILQYRQVTKLKSTYVDGLLNVVRTSDNRLHSSFNQLITATGRLSSTEPNLQNIPTRQELGREIRKMFVAKSTEYVLVDADYSQIELRILAHMSKDKNMIDAFNNNEDIHASTAAKVYNVPLEQVTPKMRSNAKAVNFGIVYGISDFGLAKDIGVSVKEAKQFITEYLENFSGVKDYMDRAKMDAKELGYAETMYKRKRYLPELKAANFQTRSFGERVAMNTPIQGTAADIIKLAMVKVFNRLKKAGLKSKLLLQVHDELIIEAPLDEVYEVQNILVDAMQDVVKLDVPLIAEAKSGFSWYDTK